MVARVSKPVTATEDEISELAKKPPYEVNPSRVMAIREEDHTVYRLISKVLADLPAIGKDNKAPAIMGGYSFRGIDGVLNALNPILSKHELFFVPKMVDRTESVRKTKSGGDLFVVNLLVEYTFHGPLGDKLTCSVWGEGSDSGDKATQKAMTSAMKYMLFQVFAISTEEQGNLDIDRNGEVETREVLSPVEERKRAFETSGATLPDGWKDFEEFDEAHQRVQFGMSSLAKPLKEDLAQFRVEQNIPWPMSAEQMHVFLDKVAEVRKGYGFEGVDETPAGAAKREAEAE